MLLNALGYLVAAAGACLVAFGGMAVAMSKQEGLNGTQAVVVGMGCFGAAAVFFALEGIRKRLARIEAKLDARDTLWQPPGG